MMNSTKVDIESVEKAVPNNVTLGFFKRWQTKLAKVKWSNVFYLSILHILFVIGGAYVLLSGQTINMYTVIFTYVIGLTSGIGMSVGGHRLWAHKSFKARLPLRILLSILQAMTMNGSAYSYARDHRTHHKNTDTDCDPKNPSRGLFYSHIGWWCLVKSQQVKDAGSKLDFSDLKDDWVVWYQHLFYKPIFVVFGIILPVAVPYYLWNEHLLVAFFVCVVFRVTTVLHHLFTVNSLAHFFGSRPYDYRIRPTENRLVIYLSLGEGNHNYHHTFPYDYSSSEKKAWEFFNPSTLFIDFAVAIGLAYDRKKASRAVIEGTISRKGIPAHFDKPRGICFRIFNGLCDWILGIALHVWPVAFGFAYEHFSGRTIFVYGIQAAS